MSQPSAEGAGALLARAIGQRGEGVIFVGAHPDDETFALGGHLPRLSGATVVIVTDGAPRDLRDANKVGFATAEDYARARSEELVACLALAGIPPEQLVTLGVPDQQPILNLTSITHRLAELFRERRPWLVLTHAYEGGHPDHDAVAFAVHAACHVLSAESEAAPTVVEMPYYRPDADGRMTQSFEPGSGPEPHVVELTDAELALKNRMMEQHASQLRLFGRSSSSFRTRNESFRVAPAYDFTTPPNESRVNYENWQLGVTGAEWMERARAALAELGLAR